MRSIVEDLNPAQLDAVLHGTGPALVLAGAGSGKTRVLTCRVAHLVLERGVDPSGIVAVTFTNKAAREMKERVERLLSSASFPGWIGTFHALCLRILRRDGDRVGLAPGFGVYDTADQLAVVKEILRRESTEEDALRARSILSAISAAKNSLEDPAALAARAHSPEDRLRARVFALYEEALRVANVVDFDDLLLKAVELLRRHPEPASRLASRCQHLLVDEFQDTNRPQYLLMRGLSAVHGNVFVVGDEDQSIYRFRGAEIRNILDFEKDYPQARVLKLEQNYRSTGTILDAAGGLIAHNRSRKGKVLWTRNDRGQRIELSVAPDDRTEAIWVARRIRELEPQIPHERIAVLYRTNAQSRQFEEIFRRDRIPYAVVGSVQFYERKEVRDILAYLKLLANPSDDVSFRRIVNTPARGLGEGTMRAIEDAARERGCPFAEAARAVVEAAGVPGKQARELQGFLEILAELRRDLPLRPVAETVRALLRAVDYQAYLDKAYPGQGADRMDNVRSLVSAAVEYEGEAPEPSLLGFLERSALVSDADDVGRGPGVTLMTIHCAKGLEFAGVFLTGLEENLFPHARAARTPEDVEEERRLCYVAMTRAQDRLFLSRSLTRLVQGIRMPNPASRFLAEIPGDLLEEVFGSPSDLMAERSLGGFDGDSGRGSSALRAAVWNRRRATEERKPAPGTVGPDPGDGFAVGASVHHPRFGAGRILEREGSGKNLKLTIRFVQYGSKKILPAYTELQVETTGAKR